MKEKQVRTPTDAELLSALRLSINPGRVMIRVHTSERALRRQADYPSFWVPRPVSQ